MPETHLKHVSYCLVPSIWLVFRIVSLCFRGVCLTVSACVCVFECSFMCGSQKATGVLLYNSLHFSFKAGVPS